MVHTTKTCCTACWKMFAFGLHNPAQQIACSSCHFTGTDNLHHANIVFCLNAPGIVFACLAAKMTRSAEIGLPACIPNKEDVIHAAKTRGLHLALAINHHVWHRPRDGSFLTQHGRPLQSRRQLKCWTDAVCKVQAHPSRTLVIGA